MNFSERITDYSTGAGLVTWMEEYNFGSIFIHLSTYFSLDLAREGAIRRRNPDSEEIEEEYSLIVINFDKMEKTHSFSPDFWKYANEVAPESPNTFKIDHDGIIKLYFASYSEKWVIKGSMNLFFLFSYIKKPLKEITYNDLKELEEFAKHFFKFHELCAINERKMGRAKHHYLCPFLDVKKSTIREFIGFSKDQNFINSPLSRLVDEIWELKIDDQENFEWIPLFILHENTRKLLEKWKNHSRIQRTNKVGEKFYLNDQYREKNDENHLYDVYNLKYPAWDSSTIEPLHLPESSHLEIFDEEKIDLKQDYPQHLIHGFLKFYKHHFNNQLDVIQINNGVALCKETRKNHPKYVLVKIMSRKFLFRGYGIGSQIIHTFFHSRSNDLRFFTYEPNAFLREEGIDMIRDLHESYSNSDGVFQYVILYCAYLRNMRIVDINLMFGGFLTDYGFQEEYFSTKRYLTNIQQFFIFNEEQNLFAEVPYDLEAANRAFQDEIERRRLEGQQIAEGLEKKKNKEEENQKWRKENAEELERWHREIRENEKYCDGERFKYLPFDVDDGWDLESFFDESDIEDDEWEDEFAEYY